MLKPKNVTGKLEVSTRTKTLFVRYLLNYRKDPVFKGAVSWIVVKMWQARETCLSMANKNEWPN